MMSKRFRYFIGHLILSIIIALAISSFLLTQWYPTPLMKAVGISSLFIIMLLTQVSVWPLLSFTVYKKNKKSLLFDLNAILALQIIFWIFIVYMLAQGRPVWIAYTLERFELVKVNEIVITDMNAVNSQFKYLSWAGPKYVGTRLARDAEVRSNQLAQEVFNGISLGQRQEQYINIALIKNRLVEEQQSLEELRKYNEISKVDKALASYPDAHGFIPLRAQQVDMVVLLDNSGTPLQIVDLRPWE